ncbi:perlucin-like protein isoform X2 [Saccostrea cucullata]|uniref:perlucin-like protein isoform X2 n=1 Tax=Saccostrea cuccullata TaxID=36930 RepID=UPI002ED2BFBF
MWWNNYFVFYLFYILNVVGDSIAVSFHCDRGWDKFEDKCYRLFPGSRNWHQARDGCTAHGSTLPVVSNRRIQRFIIKQYGHLLGSHGVYLSGNDIKREGSWEWLDEDEPFSFHTWYKGEPNNDNGDGDCLHIWKTHGYQWNDVACNYPISNFLCSKPVCI